MSWSYSSGPSMIPAGAGRMGGGGAGQARAQLVAEGSHQIRQSTGARFPHRRWRGTDLPDRLTIHIAVMRRRVLRGGVHRTAEPGRRTSQRDEEAPKNALAVARTRVWSGKLVFACACKNAFS